MECHALRISIENGDTDWEADLVGAYHKLRLTGTKDAVGRQTDDHPEKVPYIRGNAMTGNFISPSSKPVIQKISAD